MPRLQEHALQNQQGAARHTSGRYAVIPDRTLREELFGTTPPGGRSPTLTFMIRSRIGKNTLPVARSGLVKKRSKVVNGAHERAPNLVILHQLTHKEVTTFDVLHPTVMLITRGAIRYNTAELHSAS